ncbi:MAG: hypothetical protein OJF49_000847 [Ktedonobacterales bacterium]|nr:MAG: hypothetical protein OJF49_000847 [Ktedonobacterales bacterium]
MVGGMDERRIRCRSLLARGTIDGVLYVPRGVADAGVV